MGSRRDRRVGTWRFSSVNQFWTSVICAGDASGWPRSIMMNRPSGATCMPLRVRTRKQRTRSRGYERRMRLDRDGQQLISILVQFSPVALPNRRESAVGRDCHLALEVGKWLDVLRSGRFHSRHRPASVHPVRISDPLGERRLDQRSHTSLGFDREQPDIIICGGIVLTKARTFRQLA